MVGAGGAAALARQGASCAAGCGAGCYAGIVEADAFDEETFFRALAQVRCLLIGRRAMVALGLPVLTADYDLWLHIDDIEALNALVVPLELRPTLQSHLNRPPQRPAQPTL